MPAIGSSGLATRSGVRLPAKSGLPRKAARSFADAESAENLVEHLLRVDPANQIAERFACLVQMNRGDGRGQHFVTPGTTKRLELAEGAANGVLMTRLCQQWRVELGCPGDAVEHDTDRSEQSLHASAGLGADSN